MHVFLATLGTETNTFSTFPTGIDSFRHRLWQEGDVENAVATPWSAPARNWRNWALEEGWKVSQGLHAFAEPAGTTTRSAYETMRDRILADLKAAGPVDAVMMFMHGAMVADGYDDCEGDMATRIREIVGDKVKIGIELDLHAHIDQVLVDAADIIVFYKTYPHFDHTERARDVFDLMKRTLAGEIDPVMALFDCRTMGLFPTTMDGPMPAYMEKMVAAEGRDGILSLSLNHGFPWADVPLAGAKMLAIADGDMAKAEAAAGAFGKEFYGFRAQAMLPFTPFDEAIEKAKVKGDKPILLADTSDQIGSGAPGDTTYMLRALIDAGIRSAAVAPLYDPLAVNICFQVGVGAKLPMRIGGKLDPNSGPFLDADVEVLFLKRGAYQEHVNNERIPVGDLAVIRVEGIEVVLTTERSNLFSPTLYTLHGITIDDKQVLAIKNLYKHKDIFIPLTREQLFVASPGCSNPDFGQLPFKRLPRPIWPLDPDPLGLDPG
ncbi:M81 family metallopeptidase [Frigidibacter sp. ROC022]|uniref:M81 family metallopeptidase n=1 Tax=Frigidibacter sp. ROC022 TaxID=2971796 RepID=UPI00215AEB10|nr:M81 family metallopeptidase [Frigidibacter sp. ROC022]MCR8726055.1 M81 family metallopeptidase [Frigidibacter sp. ROC022]